MPRKISKEVKERPAYISADGTLDLSKVFRHQPKQTELLRNVQRNGKVYVQPAAPQCLSVGGIRSGKTSGWLMFGVMHYCLAFKGCDILVLRRTFKELESGAIADFKTFVPEELYNYDQTKHVATFVNGSRVVFGHCLAAGTLVTTQRGLVPIEDVTTQDLALTRKGYKRVLWSGKTGDKEVVQLGPLSLTKEHKVFANDVWKSVEEIACQKDSEKTVRLLCHKPSYLKTLSTIDTQNQNEDQTELILEGGETELKPISTSLCGNALVGEVSPKDTKYTTKTTIPCTTSTQTLNSLSYRSTGSTTLLGESVEQADPCLELLGKLNAGSAEQESQQEQLKNDFATLTVEMPSGPTSHSVPVYDLQIEDEHEFFANGVLVHNCQNNKERDIEQYLGQAYPLIIVDEAGQFSPDAWHMLYSRNTVNASCKEDEFGNLPIPAIVGCTNPLGPFYEFYRTVFVEGEPWQKPEDARKDETDGTWWVKEAGEWKLIYNPPDYAHQRSTVMDNPELLKRDPGIITRLNSLPKAKRDKMLLGLDGKFEGQYFDCWDQEYHVINLREDPDAIIWQHYQPVWAGEDWGMGHANATYLFTKALVRASVGTDYKLKTVCFQEIVVTGGKTYKELASIIASRAKLPNGAPVKLKAIYFSHEKFSRVMDRHSPADDYSRELKSLGLPGVTQGTRDRIGSASLMYNMLSNGELVVLDYCKDIILAIPSLMRDPDNLDDVLKVDAKGDDCYDGFRLGLYGQLAAKKKPEVDSINEYAKTLDPIAAHFFRLKMLAQIGQEGQPFKQAEIPVWQSKLRQQ